MCVISEMPNNMRVISYKIKEDKIQNYNLHIESFRNIMVMK